MGNESRTDARNEARERFFALFEDELTEERALTDDELRYKEHVAAEDSECRAFSAVIEDLRRPEPVAAVEIDRAIREHQRASRTSHRNGIIAFAVTTASIAAAAAIVFAVLFGEPDVPSSQAPMDRAAFLLTAEGGSRAGTGHVFTTASAPLLLRSDEDVTVGLDRSSSIRVAALDASSVSLRLTRGRVAIHLKPGGSRKLKVITPLCDVSVTGTVFSVAVEPGEVRVGVVRGSVAVSNAAQGEIARVRGGQSFSVLSRDTNPLDGAAAGGILALLGMNGVRPDALRPAAVAGAQDSAIAAPVRTIDAGVAVQKSGGDTLGKIEKGAAAKSSSGQIAADTPADLIRRARDHVKAQEWAGAVALYRQIARDFPERQEAITVRVPLAGIELDHLGSPGTALTDYRYYLATAPNGPLAEDALYGVCSALKRLGRTADERSSLNEFLRRFPQSLHAPAAKIRLNEVGEP